MTVNTSLRFYGLLHEVCSPGTFELSKHMTNREIFDYIKTLLPPRYGLFLEGWNLHKLTIEDITKPKWINHKDFDHWLVQNVERRYFQACDIKRQHEKQGPSKCDSHYRRCLLACLEYAITKKTVIYTPDGLPPFSKDMEL